MSAIQAYFNNDLEKLAELCSNALSQPIDNGLYPEYVIVHSQGMAHWLQCYIARHHGIAARIKFLFPGHFLDLLRQQCSDAQHEDLWSPDILLWRIFAHLQKAKSPALKQYLGDERDTAKAYQLASSLSETFDKYRVYRSQQLEDWINARGDKNYSWQYELLQELAKDDNPLNHHQELADGVLHCDLTVLPKRVFVFGMSSIAPRYLDILSRLATRIPIHMYSLSPSPAYTGDIISEKKLLRLEDAGETAAQEHYDIGNSMIAQCGMASCEFQILLDSANAELQDSEWREQKPNNLLERVQHDIYTVQEPGIDNKTHKHNKKDLSIQFHNCHNPQRELETLRDFILRNFRQDKSLKADDIIIMAPNPEVYAPYIDAVFNYMHDGNEIPVSLADQHQQHTKHIIDAFLHMLNCSRGRLEKEQVLDLLYMPSVQERWGWNQDSMQSIESLLDQAGVQWGRDADHREQLGIGSYADFTWLDSLRRILFSHFAGDDDQLMDPLNGLLPIDDIESIGADLICDVLACIQELMDIHKRIPACKHINDWELLLQRILQVIAEDNERNANALQFIREQISTSIAQIRSVDTKIQINIDTIVTHLSARCQHHDSVQGFYDGRITFSGLKPMRSIPFKIICLVGMNDKEFPRQSKHLDFDLSTNAQRCYGDRDLNSEDRQLFLETIISCRHTLYMSFCGQNARNQQIMPPAHIVEEFVDYLAKTCGQPREELFETLCYQHHLHPSHPHYTAPKSSIQTQSQLHYHSEVKSPTVYFLEHSNENVEPPTQLHIDDLINFWQNPSAYLLRYRYAINLGRIGNWDDGRDEFYWDSLHDYKIRDLLFQHDGKTNVERLQAQRILPIADFGNVIFLEKQTLTEPFIEIKQSLHQSDPLSITCNNTLVNSDHLWRNKDGALHFIIPHTYNSKRRLYCWLHHVLANCVEEQESYVNYLSSTSMKQERLKAYPNAIDYLEILIDGYQEGLSQAIPFFVDTSYTYAEQIFKDKEPIDVDVSTAKKWFGTGPFSSPESQQAHLHLCWPDPSMLIKQQTFKQWANDIWHDYLECSSK